MSKAARTTPLPRPHARLQHLDPKAHPCGLAIRRNYENAFKAAGATVAFSDDNISVLKAVRNGVEVWAEVQARHQIPRPLLPPPHRPNESHGPGHHRRRHGNFHDRDGFVALDIRFATARAHILPESRPTFLEIVTRSNPDPQ